MSNPENLAAIQAAGYHWLVAAAQPERVCYFDQYEEPRLAGRKSCASLLRAMKASTKCVCSLSRHKVLMAPRASPCAGAKAAQKKNRAIRQKQKIRLLADIEKLGKRIALGRLRTTAKIYEA